MAERSKQLTVLISTARSNRATSPASPVKETKSSPASSIPLRLAARDISWHKALLSKTELPANSKVPAAFQP